MNEQPFNNSLVIVGVVFGVLLMGMYILEVVQPVGRQADAETAAAPVAPALPAQPPPKPEAPVVDLAMKEREIKGEIDRLTFDLDGYRRDLDALERREREHNERFQRAGLEEKGRLMGVGVRLGSESLKAGNKVRDTEYRIRKKHEELQELYQSAKR